MGRRRRRAGLTREDIVLTAIRILKLDGPDGLGIRVIARELGVRAPSLYNHIRSAEDLQHAIAVEGWRQLAGAFDEAAALTDSGIARLKAIARMTRRFARLHSGLYHVMTTTQLEGDKDDFAAVSSHISLTFAEALSPLGLDDSQLVHATRTLRAALHGFIALELNGHIGPGAADPSFEILIETVLHGLRAQHGASPA